jgi:mRNA interferase MazF
LTLNSGDVVYVELGVPAEREAGYLHPAVLVTAQAILDAQPTVVHIVPVTSTLRRYATEVEIEPEPDNGLTARSAAQCQHVRAVAPARLGEALGNVGAVALTQIREMLAIILDLPS